MNDLRIIDAHSHLWLKQDTVVDGMRIRALANGRSEFMGELRQMQWHPGAGTVRWGRWGLQ